MNSPAPLTTFAGCRTVPRRDPLLFGWGAFGGEWQCRPLEVDVRGLSSVGSGPFCPQ